MSEVIPGDFTDRLVPPGRGIALRYKFKRDGKVHRLYHYVSSTCDVTVLNSGKHVFPEGGKISVYNIFVIFDLPSPIVFKADEELQVEYNNTSAGNVRIISGFAGTYS